MNTYQCYQALGLQEGASIKDVKSSYRRLALKYHPDKNSSDQDSIRFKTITEAYQILRAQYKDEIHSQNSGGQKGPGQAGPWGAKKSDRTPSEDWTRYTRYAEDEYQDFWKRYENTFWEYYERARSSTREEAEPVRVERDVAVAVSVDPGKCIACCSCETIAPTVFRVEKNVKVNPKSHVIDECGARSEKILDAAQTCPTKAISVSDKESCRQLYPW